MTKKSTKKVTLTPMQRKNALEAASIYYAHRHDDGSLYSQKEIATKYEIDPPRFSEALKDAWRSQMIKIIIESPPDDLENRSDHLDSDYAKIKDLEVRLTEKLRRFSSKLIKVHVVPSTPGFTIESGARTTVSPGKQDIQDSIMARICNKAANEFFRLIDETYQKRQKAKEKLYCGIGWSRTCERIVNLMPAPQKAYSNTIVCPLIGFMGHKSAPMDSNFLAFRLGSILLGDSIKLPCPSIRPLELENLEELRPIRRALSEIRKCEIAISGIGKAYYEKGKATSSIIARKMIEENEATDHINRLKKTGAVAEIHCHYFDIDGQHISYEQLGFKPIGVSVKQMQLIPRYIVVVSPHKEKILPTIVSVKAGICSDLVMDHNIAVHMLNEL